MDMSNHGRMLGPCDQPFCGKCCGYHGKRATAIHKRRQKRADRQALREENR